MTKLSSETRCGALVSSTGDLNDKSLPGTTGQYPDSVRASNQRRVQLTFPFPASLVDQVLACAHQHGKRPEAILHTTLAVLLARLTTDTDIRVATSLSEAAAIVDGLAWGGPNATTACDETVVLTHQIVLGTPFATLFQQADIGALCHLNSRSYQDGPKAAGDAQSATRARVRLDSLGSCGGGRHDYDLALTAPFPLFNDGTLKVDFDTAAFTPHTVQRFVDRWLMIIAAGCADPMISIDAFDLLNDAERRQTIAAGAGPSRPTPEASFIETFETQVSQYPDSVALLCDSEHISYSELDQRANALAEVIIGRRVTLVGVALRLSVTSIVAILATAKAGVGYLPLDLDYPISRLAYMVGDAAPDLLLVDDPDFPARLKCSVDTLVITPDYNYASADRPTFSRPLRNPKPAVVIYTSGSTGRPKGVMLSVANITAYLDWAVSFYRIPPMARAPIVTSMSFDGFILSILVPLLSGATLVLPGACPVADMLLNDAREGRSAGFLNTTPSHIDQLALAAGENAVALADIIAVGGEMLHAQTIARFVEADRQVTIVNDYGPTETTVSSTAHRIDIEAASLETTVPVGRPIANCHIFILDNRLRPVPIGTRGEVYIAGYGVANGYVRRPGETSSRFVACPFLPNGERMYRTGDLARWRTDGLIEIVGRIDAQVKIRGFRVEPSEIAATMSRQDGITSAVVAAVAGRSGEPQLVGYAVVDEAQLSTVNAPADAVAGWDSLNQRLYAESTDIRSEDKFWGWDSSYTGLPIPTAEMAEWQAETCQRILELRPRRVLEIGVGDGLMLQEIAPSCEEYWGIDLSSDVIDYCRQLADLRPEIAAKVRLRVQEATCAEGLPPSYFDTVVMNSVAAYFPDVDYLENVMKMVATLLAPKGRFFIGDVRNLATHRLFSATMEISRASPDLSAADLLSSIDRNSFFEEELLIHPSFFTGLRDYAAADIQLKRGFASNELTRHRYDVVLYLSRDGLTSFADVPTMDWSSEYRDLAGLLGRLEFSPSPRIRVRDLPYGRLHGERMALELVTTGDTASARAALNHVPSSDFDRLFTDTAALPGYRFWPTWSHEPGSTRFDLCVERIGNGDTPSAPVDLFLSDHRPARLVNQVRSRSRVRALERQIRDTLAIDLPDYMVPSAIVLIDAVPLTANGKLDTAALPRPLAEAGRGEWARNGLEEELAALFGELLGLRKVSRDDHFFLLGGHSLLATRLVSRIRDVFGAELTIRTIFQAPTVAHLAQFLVGSLPGRQPIVAGHRPDPLPLSFAQSRLWFLAQLNGPNAAYNMPFILSLAGSLDQAALQTALNDIVDRHESLRTVFADDRGEPYQVILPPGTMLPFVRREIAEAGDAEAILREFAQAPFDLAASPPVRSLLLKRGEDLHDLMIVIHHIAADGWSLLPLWRDLERAYAARRDGAAPDWAPLAV
ncbi:amino acid adenylation domain-containing protein, partial [Sphingomonas sp. 1185]|uniref:non-ribosomal peptide synthetase n=1 Tax=Sphingomonas sp. 1185 TaxID=3156411 RepID=UPI00339288BD